MRIVHAADVNKIGGCAPCRRSPRPERRLDEAAVAWHRAAEARARRQFRSNGRARPSPAAQKDGRGASVRSGASAGTLVTRAREPDNRAGGPPGEAARPGEAAFPGNVVHPGEAARLGDAARSGKAVLAAGSAESSRTETTEVNVAAYTDGTAMGDVPPAVLPPPRW